MKVDQKIVGIFQELLDLASSVTQTRSSGGGKSEKEIDDLTIAQADDDSAWGKPVQVRRSKSEAVSIPAEVASRAAFFARLHREPSLEHWIKKGHR